MRRVITVSACIVSLFMLVGSLQPAFSQNIPTAEERVAEIDEAVGLTGDQKEKLTKHFEEQMERIQEMRDRMREQRDNDQGNNQPQGRPEGMTRSGFSGMSMRISPEIQEILTDEQLEKYKLYISEQNIERRINMYDRRLELTDDQKDGIRKILVDVQEQISKLTPSENMSRSERRKLNSTMNDIREESNEAIKKLLKGDQVTAFEEMQERMNSRRRGRR